MNVVLTGFGKMGKELYSVLEERGHKVVGVIDPFSLDKRVTSKNIEKEAFSNADVVIDFSSPENAVENIKKYMDFSIPAIIGTTGWLDGLDCVKAYGEGKDLRIMYSGNYSIGVALFLKLCRKAGELYGKVAGYDASIYEIHHTEKKDSPSGTALMVASALMETMEGKKKILLGNSEGKIEKDSLQISSMRVGKTPGVHSVIIDSDADTITLTHTDRSRAGFALCAVMAAEWIKDTTKRGILTLDDYLNETFGE